MSRRFVLVIALVFVLMNMFTVVFKIQRVEASETIYIRSDGSIEPSTANITSLDNVTYTFNGNIINESIVVERDNIIVDGAGFTLQGTGEALSKGIDLTARSNITIKNTKIKAFDFGIYLNMSSSNSIYGNEITANGQIGVWLKESSNNKIYGNNLTNNYGSMDIWWSSNNVIHGNNLTNNYWGIELIYCSNTSISENVMNGNEYNFAFYGYYEQKSHYFHSIDASNLVDGKPVYYLVNQTGLVINPATYPQVGYLALINCVNITLEDMTLTNNGQGLLIAYTNNSTITDNMITNNEYGIWIDESSNNKFYGNNITNNIDSMGLYWSHNNNFHGNHIANNLTYNRGGIWFWRSSNNSISGNNIMTSNTGIDLEGSLNNVVQDNNITNNNIGVIVSFDSSNNSIVGNYITDNNYGVSISESSNNSFYHNNLIDNTQQVYIATSGYTNFWDNGVEGNYWSNYAGVDLDHDGIGDTPHIIDANNTDNHPLMMPIGFFNAGTWNDTTYHVHAVSNSTISDFYFSESEKLISFNINGTDGTVGFCRVTIPKTLMWCDDLAEWNVTVNGNPPTYMEAMEDADYTYLYFTYNHSIQEAQIKGVHVIPEFPSFLILPLFIMATLLAVIVHRRKYLTKPNRTK